MAYVKLAIKHDIIKSSNKNYLTVLTGLFLGMMWQIASNYVL